MLAHLKKFIVDRLAHSDRRLAPMPIRKYLEMGQVDCVLDVGANIGQYGSELRRLGYRGRIVSFEPLPKEFAILSEKIQGDPNWVAYNSALGSTVQNATFSVNANSASSSFLPVDDRVDVGFVNLSVVDTIDVSVQTLDSMFAEAIAGCRNIFLKIDTQGFERQVIAGATDSLPKIQFVQMEASLVPHYVGETLIEELISVMKEKGFEPWWIMDGYNNPKTLQLFQVDVFFRKKD